MEAAGNLYFNFADTDSAQKWARGEDMSGYFGPSVFPPCPQVDVGALPRRLFDLVDNRVVMSHDAIMASTQSIEYVILSHVWGDVTEIDGTKYGVEWNVPIRSQDKLDEIITFARIIGGVRYMWIDVLCLDQRVKNETQIANMGTYYSNATGCLVWLDDTYDEGNWNEVLSAIEEVNKFFKMDIYGVPTISVHDMMHDNMVNMNMSVTEAFEWINKIVAVENAPWFKRIWTLQEGVIPEHLFFCTPEKYMVNGPSLFHIISLCGMVAQLFVETGSMATVAITHELQKSEMWKILRLRQLFRKKSVSYWHVIHATRTRRSKHEHDRIFGICGLIPDISPTVDYDRNVGGLYREIYRSSINKGRFSTCCFIGNNPLEPDEDSMGYLIPDASAEKHKLLIDQAGLQIEGAGVDDVTRVHCIIGSGNLASWAHESPNILEMSVNDHLDISKAFEMPSDCCIVTGSAISPAAFAAISAMGPIPDDILNQLGKEFADKYASARPKGLLMWVKASMLMQASKDTAVVIIWTASSDPQLAVVTEKIAGRVTVVTPSSYVDNPGYGCLVCRLNSNGALRKIGVGIGSKVKARKTVSYLECV
jgi:hypothetical protein